MFALSAKNQTTNAELYHWAIPTGTTTAFTICTSQVVLNASVAHPEATYSVVSMCHLNLIIGVNQMFFTSRENPCWVAFSVIKIINFSVSSTRF